MGTAFLVLLLAAGASDAERAEELNREASAISQTGDYAAALAKYLEAVELAPDNDLYISNAGLASWGLGKLDEAAEWLRRAVELAAAQAAYDRVQRYHMQIAQLRYVQPDWANEKRLQNAAQPTTPEEHVALERFQALYGQTIQLTQAGEAGQALESARALVAFARETYGDGHLNTLASLNALGDALRAAGQALESAPIHQEALKGAKTLLGGGHPDTLVYMHNLAGDWMAADKPDMARPVFEKLVRLARKTLGKDHPITATYMVDLGQLYVKLGRKGQAQAILEQAFHIKQRELGAAHPETLATQQALAEALVATGKKAKAADELLAGYAQGKRVLGQLHPTTDGMGEAALALLDELHRYEAMVPVLRDMLAALRAEVGEQHQATISVTTRLAQTLELRGEVKEAHELFARALAAGRAAKLEPRELSTLVNNLAMAERRAGNLYAAEPLFEEAVALVSAELGPTHEETLQTRNNRALLLSGLGRYAQARREYEAILAARRQSLEPDDPELLRSMHNLGMFYAKLGRLEEAHRLVRAALRGRTRVLGESHPDTLYSLHGLATLYYSAGDYERAQQAFERVVALRRKVLGDTHADTLISMSSLGQLYQDQGRLAKAVNIIREVYERRRQGLGPDHPQTFDALNDLAIIYLEVGRQRQALRMFDEALAGTRKRLGPLHPETIKVMNNVAQAHYGAGEYAKAKALQQETLELSREVSGAMQPESVLYLGNLAVIVDRLGEDEEALRLFHQALAAKRKVFGPLHPETMLTLYNLAGFHLRREQWQEAGKYLDQVYALTSKFLLTVLWGADAQTRQSVVSTHGFYDATVLSYWIQRGRAREVLDYAVNRKGLLLDIAAQVNAVSEAQRDPKLEKAAATLERLRRDLAGLVTRGVAAEKQEAVTALQAQIEQLEAQLGRAIGATRARRAISVRDVIAAIPAGSVLVELVGYVDVDLRTLEPAALASVAVVVDPRKPKEERVRLVDLGRSDAWIEDLEALPAAVGASDGEAMRAVSRKLYDAVWAPLVPALGDADRVLLVPDGRMHLLPFSALVDADGRYLAETTRLTLLSSSRDLLRRRKSRARGKQGAPVIIAGPAFGGKREKATQRLSRVTFSPLPGAEAEGREVAQVMSAGKLAPSLLIGEAARESALASVASPRILHLATHGFVSLGATRGRAASRGVKLGRLKAGIEKVAKKKKEETVEAEIGSWSVLDALVRTGVALSGANEPAPLGEEDGILTGLEALALDLDGTELVVLSACETGLGRLVTQGEGVYGLRRAFQEAGARSVVSTLWPIDDAATRAFMTSFYRHFLGGASASDAVRAAQQAFIANPRWKHPYYWAAFTAVERQ